VGRRRKSLAGPKPVRRRFEREAVERAGALIASTVGAQARADGLKEDDVQELVRLVLLDFDEHVAQAVQSGEQPPVFERERFANAAGLNKSTVNEKFNKLAPPLAKIALRVALRLSLVGRAGAPVQVQLETAGPASKRVFGPMFPVDGICVHGLMVRPREPLDPTKLADQVIEDVLAPLSEAVGVLAASKGKAASDEDDAGERPEDPVPHVHALIPVLDVGHDQGLGSSKFLSPDVEVLEEWVSSKQTGSARVEKIVVELERDSERENPQWRDYFQLQSFLGWAGKDAPLFQQMSLETCYDLEADGDRLLVVRRRVALDATDAAEAGHSSTFAMIGFANAKPELLKALELAEALSSRGRATASAACFEETMAPLGTRLLAEGISFQCSCRLIAYAALLACSSHIRNRGRPRQ